MNKGLLLQTHVGSVLHPLSGSENLGQGGWRGVVQRGEEFFTSSRSINTKNRQLEVLSVHPDTLSDVLCSWRQSRPQASGQNR